MCLHVFLAAGVRISMSRWWCRGYNETTLINLDAVKSCGFYDYPCNIHLHEIPSSRFSTWYERLLGFSDKYLCSLSYRAPYMSQLYATFLLYNLYCFSTNCLVPPHLGVSATYSQCVLINLLVSFFYNG